MVLVEVKPRKAYNDPGRGLAMAGAFICREDRDHTDRCVGVIRARNKREARAELVDIRTSTFR